MDSRYVIFSILLLVLIAPATAHNMCNPVVTRMFSSNDPGHPFVQTSVLRCGYTGAAYQ